MLYLFYFVFNGQGIVNSTLCDETTVNPILKLELFATYVYLTMLQSNTGNTARKTCSAFLVSNVNGIEMIFAYAIEIWKQAMMFYDSPNLQLKLLDPRILKSRTRCVDILKLRFILLDFPQNTRKIVPKHNTK